MKTCIFPFALFILLACNNERSPNKLSDTTVAISAANDSAVDNNVHVEIYKPEALNLLDSNVKPEIIASGFAWSEGPLYIQDGDYLLFSDVPNNKVYKWTRNGDTSTYLTPSGFTGEVYHGRERGSNGLLLNKKGELVLMQHGNRSVAKMNAPLNAAKPVFTILADNYQGKKLNSPNDAVLASNGAIYFTDPPYGLDGLLNDTTKQLPFQGVYVLQPNGKLELVTDEVKFPNGICLSPDEKYLYVSNSDPDNKIWIRFELDKNGLKKNSKLFYKATGAAAKQNGNPDGMKMSKSGYLFAAGPKGIFVLNNAGELVAKIYTGRYTSNCAFGKDNKELFITCAKEVMRIPLK